MADPIETPVAATPPVSEAAPVVEATPIAPTAPEFTPHTDTASVLGQAPEPPPAEPPAPDAPPAEPPKPDDKPAEVTEAKPPEPAPVEAPPPEPITYPQLTLPEGVVADQAKIAAFDTILQEGRISPEIRQKLADLHSETIQAFVNHQLAEQHRVFGETRQGWLKEAMADEQFGGAAWETSTKAMLRMRDRFACRFAPTDARYAADMKSFTDMLNLTGAGDHPAMMRFLHNVARAFDEPALKQAEIKPTPTNGVDPTRSRRERLYDNR